MKTSGRLKSRQIRIAIIIAFISLLCFSGLTQAADNNTEAAQKTDKLPSIKWIDGKLSEFSGLTRRLLSSPLELNGGKPGQDLDAQQQASLILTRLNSAYLRLKNAILALNQTQDEKRTVQKIYDDFRTRGMAQKPPYSLAFYDAKKIEISAIEKNRQNLEFTIERLDKDIADHKDNLTQKQSELRQIKEKAGSVSASPLNGVSITEWHIEYFKVMIQAMETEKERQGVEIDTIDLRHKLLGEQEKLIRANIKYDPDDLKHQLELIETKKKETHSELERIRKDQDAVELEWSRAQQQLANTKTESERNIAQAYLNARGEWKQTYKIVIEMKQSELVLLDRQQTVWENRYAIVKGDIGLPEKKQIQAEANKAVSKLDHTLQVQQNYLNNIQNQLSSLDAQIQETGQMEQIKRYLTAEKEALARQFERRLEYQSTILSSDRLEKSLLNQIQDELDETSIKERVYAIWQVVKGIWKLEIWAVDEHSVYLGKVLVAVLILIVGIIITRFIMHRLYNRLLEASQFKETTASAMYKGFSYFAYLMVFLFALRLVNIPLTAFAFLGGAVAIGVGFGAQNLINNFISGFIILGERPINIGDLIEVDGLLGKVEEIGARCTRVRTGENVHKLIPNSSFLEKNITNWTLSDNRIRTKIVVGVAYGSPVKKVEENMLKAAQRNPRVLKSPEPFVLFSDFGDNALIFELYFWVTVRLVLEKKLIESQIRFEIDELFRNEDIVIAFPQRDIHFDSDKPLRIHMSKEHLPEN